MRRTVVVLMVSSFMACAWGCGCNGDPPKSESTRGGIQLTNRTGEPLTIESLVVWYIDNKEDSILLAKPISLTPGEKYHFAYCGVPACDRATFIMRSKHGLSTCAIYPAARYMSEGSGFSQGTITDEGIVVLPFTMLDGAGVHISEDFLASKTAPWVFRNASELPVKLHLSYYRDDANKKCFYNVNSILNPGENYTPIDKAGGVLKARAFYYTTEFRGNDITTTSVHNRFGSDPAVVEIKTLQTRDRK